MRLIGLLALGAGAAYAYKRFFAGSDAGQAETAAAEPFSSESLGEEPPAGDAQSAPATSDAGGDETAAAPGDGEEQAEQRDTLERPTWLKPADSA